MGAAGARGPRLGWRRLHLSDLRRHAHDAGSAVEPRGGSHRHRRERRDRRHLVTLGWTVVAPLAAAGFFGLVSGFNDGGNLMASFTSGRLITPRVAALLLLAALAGPLVLGTAVAQTVGTNIIDLHGQGEFAYVLIMLSALVVVLLSWRVGVPTSMTLALVGAMLGWVAANGEVEQVRWSGVARILLGIPISVLGGGLLALALYAGAPRGPCRKAHAPLPPPAPVPIANPRLPTLAPFAHHQGENR